MSEKETKELAEELATFIKEHKGGDTVVIDVSQQAGWTDFFIISTVTSLAHLKGLTRDLWGFLSERGIGVLNRHKQVSKEGWELIDCGDIVIHLMSSELREFYNLEKLWHTAEHFKLK
ncbi:MAG: ribosome silencing factor [Sphaerochaetaceae bacterium]